MSKVSVVGMGYVGLPLAVAFDRKGHDVVGYDINIKKLDELKSGVDSTGEISSENLKKSKIKFVSEGSSLAGSDFIVVAVPTPVNEHRQPDLSPLVGASKAIAPFLSNGVVVVYESTVYPGVTEDVCLPILKSFGKTHGSDFKIGYSPERINPGDQVHTIDKIIKVVSGEDEETLDKLAKLYESVVDAGVHRAESIKVAEAAKVIENTQRDINIALMNELAMIFDRMGIETEHVLRAAGTKWNFLKFYPGLVGGHCIGVDPYYLTHRALALGYHPQVILAGRKINDQMGNFISEKTVKMLIKSGAKVSGSRVLVLGLTFKEDVPDFRNSKVYDIINELKEYEIDVVVHDPHAKNVEIPPCPELVEELDEVKDVDAVILAVSHQEYLGLDIDTLKKFYKGKKDLIFVDIKSAYSKMNLAQQGFNYWQL